MKTIDQIAKELEGLNSNYSSFLWTQYTTGLDLGVDSALQKINDYSKDKENFKAVCNVLEKSNDAIELRKARILHNA